MAVVDLASVEQVKGYLSINTNTDDALLERLVKSASGYIQAWLNRSFGVEQYIDKLNGNDGDSVHFPNYPVLSVASVQVNNQAIPASTGVFTHGYAFDDTMLYLRNDRFWRGRLNVVITYTAGYAEIPQEITQACIEMVVMRYKEKDRIGLTSKGLAGETIGFSQKDMADSTRHILQQYRKVAPF
jgi:hypothetical protein